MKTLKKHNKFLRNGQWLASNILFFVDFQSANFKNINPIKEKIHEIYTAFVKINI